MVERQLKGGGSFKLRAKLQKACLTWQMGALQDLPHIGEGSIAGPASYGRGEHSRTYQLLPTYASVQKCTAADM